MKRTKALVLIFLFVLCPRECFVSRNTASKPSVYLNLLTYLFPKNYYLKQLQKAVVQKNVIFMCLTK